MKIVLRVIIALILAFIPVLPLVETTPAQASYNFAFPITIQDTSNVTRTNLPVILSFGGTQLVNAGYTVNGLDTNMQNGSTSVPYMMDTTNVTTVLSSLPAGGSIPLNLLTGYSPAQTNFPIIVGDGGYVTTLDNPALEFGNNFSDNYTGFFDTSIGATKNIINKSSAVVLAVDPAISGKIVATIYATATLTPNGAGDLTDIATLVGAPTHWQSQLTNDGDTSYVEQGAGFQQTDTYTHSPVSIPISAVIDNVSVSTVARTNGVINCSVYTNVRLGGVTVQSGGHIPTNLYATYSDSLARPGGGAWAVADINNTQIGVSLDFNGAGSQRSTQTYATVNYHFTLAAVGVTSDVHTIILADDTANISLTIDGVVQETKAFSDTVADNGNNILLSQNNSMPYITSYKHTVGGVEVIHYQPNTMVSGTALPNLDSGGLYPGVITFGTNSNITIIYGQQTSTQQVSVSSNTTPGFSVPSFPMPATWFASGENLSKYTTGTVTVVNGNVTVTGLGTGWTSALVGKVFSVNGDATATTIASVNSTTVLTLSSGYPYAGVGGASYTIAPANPPPYYPLFYDIASQAGIPVQSLYFMIIMSLAVLAGLLTIVYTKGALLGVLVMTIILFFASAATIVPMWIPFSLLVVDMGIMYLYRQITY